MDTRSSLTLLEKLINLRTLNLQDNWVKSLIGEITLLSNLTNFKDCYYSSFYACFLLSLIVPLVWVTLALKLVLCY